MSQSLCFNDFTFSPVTRENQPWFKSSELARALGYANANYVTRLYHRNEDEFSSDMTQVIENGAEIQFGSDGRVRIFSLRGCHLLAMFARTPVAKSFRRWVLDVIEQYGERVPVSEPVSIDATRPSRRTDPERKALTAIINTWVGMAPIHYASARAQVNAHFGVASVDALTVAQVKDAIRWVQGKIDALPTLPASAPARTLPVSNIYRDRVKELERLEAKFMEFAGETRSRLSELNAEYIRLNQGSFAALLRTLPAAHPGDVDRLSSALSAQSYDAYNWIDAGLSRMRLAIVSARAANRIMG
jgi:hypothetical protein